MTAVLQHSAVLHRSVSEVMSAPEAPSFFGVRPTLRVKLCGRGPGAEADAARRLPHVSRRAAGGVPPPALGS